MGLCRVRGCRRCWCSGLGVPPGCNGRLFFVDGFIRRGFRGKASLGSRDCRQSTPCPRRSGIVAVILELSACSARILPVTLPLALSTWAARNLGPATLPRRFVLHVHMPLVGERVDSRFPDCPGVPSVDVSCKFGCCGICGSGANFGTEVADHGATLVTAVESCPHRNARGFGNRADVTQNRAIEDPWVYSPLTHDTREDR